MEVITAKTAGFCFGVKRAVEKVYEQAELAKEQKVYTFGPIIHNEEVVKDLEKKGVTVIHSEEELKALTEGIVIIRSHGVPKYIYDMLNKENITLVDATCPFVKKIHNIAKMQSEAGKQIIIVGSEQHPEVQGIVGWCSTPAITIQSAEQAEKIEVSSEIPICVVAQTTFNYKKFQDIVAILEKKGYNVNVVNTICNATQERQREAELVARDVDVMFVIGGKHSSNTQKLYEICKKECEYTYYIQTLEDLHAEWLKSTKKVGITAGASTPNKIIEEVQTHARKF
ncbi:MAG: 4-hydroxy-3-methylbut-2-enyl diphosphate reductase [Lachnospiraceae bacterium]